VRSVLRAWIVAQEEEKGIFPLPFFLCKQRIMPINKEIQVKKENKSYVISLYIYI
jgi:hypothetical protein